MRRPPLSRLLPAFVALALTGGCGVATDTPTISPSVQPVSVAPVRHAPPPTSVDIPAIGAHSTLVPLGLNPDKTVEVPPLEQPKQAGWYSLGAIPGDPGPAVLLGHVDSHGTEGIFFRLKDLKPGDVVAIGRADGSTISFRITHVDVVPKAVFPTAAVYGDTPGPEIRLVTCGGALDAAAHSYLSNVLAFGVLAA